MHRVKDSATGWDEFVAELGRNLQRVRLAQGLSQERVAYAAGLSRYTYQKYEKGESRPGAPANPTLQIVLTLAQTLRVPLSELLPPEVPDLLIR
jgi:transcriptional regulator with XRE-family HTH domain